MTKPFLKFFTLLTLLLSLAIPEFSARGADRWGRTKESFVNWEDPHVHPLEMTPDGALLLAVNTPDNSLLVFNIASGTPVLQATIPVGLDPVSVRARTSTEAWVVNRISDDVTVVDLASGRVTAVLPADDEPQDVVFAGTPQRAFVTCGKLSLVDLFDPANPSAARQSIFLYGKEPRALAVSADGQKVYAAFFESGNGTTEVTGGKANGFEVDLVRRPEGPYGGVNVPPNRGTQFVPPMNPANPAPPPVSMIVRKDASGRWMDDNNGDWSRFVSGDLAGLGGSTGGRVPGWDLPDRDVAVIDTNTLSVTYQTRLMNSLMAMAVRPGTGEVTVVGTDATNQIRWEPNLQATFVRVNLARFQPGGTSTISDLNPQLDYTVRSVPQAVRNQAIGDPRGIAWNADGSRAFITGMGSNNVVVLDGSGARVGRVDVGQGPTGIVFQAASGRVFVLDKFDAAISVIDATQLTEVVRVPFFDPTPAAIKAGRPFLYNTHLTSGLGQISCASCHIDGRTDRLAWDLGNPAGTMTTMVGVDADSGAPVTVQQPPMKGPLLTQTLQDTMNSPVLHWAGDRPDLTEFQSAFVTLQGADAPLSLDATNQLEDFLSTIHVPPNPNRNLDNTYKTALAIAGPDGTTLRTGNAVLGAQEFEGNCRSCHPGNSARGDRIRQGGGFGLILNRRPPTWRNFNERNGLWFKSATGSTSGFGFQQDGSFDSTQNQSRDDNMMAFMYSVNGGFPYTPSGLNETNLSLDAHAAVGQQLLFTSSSASASDATFQLFVSLAERGEVGLVAKAQTGGVMRGFAYTGSGVFQSDRKGETWTLAQVRAISGVLFTVVPAGSETRIGIDRNLDGILDGDDTSPTTTASFTRSQTNVAPNGTATESSIYSASYPASAAIDGSTSTFSHTASVDTAASWSLTLDKTYAIDRVVLTNRVGFESRLRDITVYFYDAAGHAIFRSHFINRNNRLNGPAQITLDLLPLAGAPIHAKSMKVMRTPDTFGRGQNIPGNSQDEQNVLSLAEVQVFGTATTDDVFAASTTPLPVPGGSFEDVDATGTYIYNPTGSPWTFSGLSGISGNGSSLTAGNPPAPAGTQVMFIQNHGAAQEKLTLAAGTYQLSCMAAQRAGYPPQTVVVFLDGQPIGVFTPAGTSYTSFQTANFTVTAGSHTIAFAGLGINPDGSDATNIMAFVDNIRIAIAQQILPIRIMPLGDSITQGYPVPGGYRATLEQSLNTAGYAVNYVGTLTSNPAAGQTDVAHEGHGGWTIGDLDVNLGKWLQTVPAPDVILLNAGTNDFVQSLDLANVATRYDSLLADLFALRPTARVIVGTVLPQPTNPTVDASIQSLLNTKLPALVAKYASQGRQISLVDFHSALTANDFSDTVHPNASGYSKMSAIWSAAVQAIIPPQGGSEAPTLADAVAISSTQVQVDFTKPVADSAASAANFSIPGLSISAASIDAATKRAVTLTTSAMQPSKAYTVTVNGVVDRQVPVHALAANAQVSFQSTAIRGATNNVAEAAGYKLLYSLDLPLVANFTTSAPAYSVNNAASIGAYGRVAYYLELQKPGGPLQYCWVSMNSFTADPTKLGVPTRASGAFFQQGVTGMNVASNVPGVLNGSALAGSLEFWPYTYSTVNSAGLPGASDSVFDFGDQPTTSGDYGSMQIHRPGTQQTLLAYNAWNNGPSTSDIGIGNGTGEVPMGRDWTFAGNAGDYTIRTLQVYVLPASPPAITTPSAQSTVQGTAASLQISASTSSGKSLSYSASGLPSGLSINAGTGLISGTVSTGAAAASTVTVTVSDGTLSASTSFIWNTTVANRPPVIVTPGSQTTVRGAAASLQLVASDPEGQVLTYSASGLPAGLSLNVSTGLISGTVSSGAAASNAVTVSASDGSLSASTTFNWATTAPITPPPATVLSGSDIGSPGLAGSDSVAAGVYTVTGGGKDIWDSSDQFHYVAQTFSGDGQIIVRVTSQTGSEAWTKAGIMFRETLNANSSFAAMELTQSVGTTFQYRSVTGGACGYNSAASNPAPNNWLRLVRQGNIFTGYVSSDGVTWTQVGTATIPMAVSINVGLAVTAHNNGLLSTATFDNLVISSPAASSGNRPPVVTTPVSQSTLRGTSGSLQIVASDPDGQSLSYAASGLPAGLSINPSSGLISGTVSNAAAATNYVTVTVSDGSLTASASFNWTVTTSPSLPLPVPLTGSDIGNPGLAGSDSYANGVYTVTGGGGDIWNTSDHFHYLSQTFTGDGQIIVRVTSQDASEIWAKAGIMFRETLNANSCCAAIVLTPGNGISFQYRSATGGGCGFTTAPSNPAPNNWLCLVRQGNVFTGYASSDGVTWTQVGSATVPMAVVVNVGLVVTAHNEGLLSTATFDNFQLKP